MATVVFGSSSSFMKRGQQQQQQQYTETNKQTTTTIINSQSINRSINILIEQSINHTHTHTHTPSINVDFKIFIRKKNEKCFFRLTWCYFFHKNYYHCKIWSSSSLGHHSQIQWYTKNNKIAVVVSLFVFEFYPFTTIIFFSFIYLCVTIIRWKNKQKKNGL